MLAIPLRDDTVYRRLPVATYGLVGACVIVHLWLAHLPPRVAEGVVRHYGMTPAVLFGHWHPSFAGASAPPWLTLFTSMFLHGGWLHFAGNMLYLWLFGRAVEGAMGSGRFLIFYLVAGIAAALTQAGTAPFEHVPMVGASGAIAGVLGAYLLLFPRANVLVFIWIVIIVRLITVPAIILLGLWFALQLMSGLSAGTGQPGVAFWAHVGGFLIGLALTPVFRPASQPLAQPRRSVPFVVMRRGQGRAFGRGSVPRAGRLR